MRCAVRTLAELGGDLVLAPERHVLDLGGDGVPLGDLVVERTERSDARSLGDAVVFDTTHARDGMLDVALALRDRARSGPARSTKKIARAGDLVVSRLRPYLRQIALVRPVVLRALGVDAIALSTEFYVLGARAPGEDVAFLLPFLLGDRAQAILGAAQEGGHHPRVPRSSLLSLRVPRDVLDGRRARSREVSTALDRLYGADAHYRGVLARPARSR